MSRLGATVARHALATIAVAIVTGAYISIHALALHASILSSNSAVLSDHAWTSLQPLPSETDVIPDLFIKQLWVQGRWMGALDPDVIHEAARIEEVLLGQIPSGATAPRLKDDANGWSRESVGSVESESGVTDAFIHSPLLYWKDSSSLESIDSILDAVNSNKHGKSAANVTLTPASVLSRPVESEGRLVAADALVASLFYKAGSSAGERWDERVEALPQSGNGNWEVYLNNAEGTGSRLFRFQSHPVSIQDDAIFLLSYSLVALLVFFCLSHVQTLRSKIWLLGAMALQVRIDYPTRTNAYRITGMLFNLLQPYGGLSSRHGCFQHSSGGVSIHHPGRGTR